MDWAPGYRHNPSTDPTEISTWHTFETVTPAMEVNYAWKPGQDSLRELLGNDWTAQIQHPGACHCRMMPCGHHERRYRAQLERPPASGYGATPREAWDNLVRALA